MSGFGAVELILVVILVAGIVMAVRSLGRRRSHASSTRATGRPAPSEPPAPVPSPAPRPARHAAGAGGKEIFLSYADADRRSAEDVARALGTLGWSVWWDRTIPPGKSFDEVIEAALAAAKCVIVLWSKASVGSHWVKTEASEGASKGILVPALIEDVTIPLEFRRIQAARLVGWNSAPSHHGFASLVDSVESLVGRAERSQ